LEGPGQGLVAVLTREEIVLALHDRAVELDWVQATRMDGWVHGRERRPAGLPAGIALRPAVGGAVVQDPEDAARRAIGLLAHHDIDQTIEGRDPGAGDAESEGSGAMHVPRGEIGPRAAPFVLMLDPLEVPGATGADR
jgi:hypothetical protein